jgi:hypothetical protein
LYLTLLTRSSDQITFEELDSVNPDGDGSHQKCLFAMFQVDLDRYDDLESLLMVHMHQQRNDIMDMEYWAFEMKLEKLIERLKKENEQHQAAQKGQAAPSSGDMSKQSSQMMKQAQQSMPKAPKMPNFKFPK